MIISLYAYKKRLYPCTIIYQIYILYDLACRISQPECVIYPPTDDVQRVKEGKSDQQLQSKIFRGLDEVFFFAQNGAFSVSLCHFVTTSTKITFTVKSSQRSINISVLSQVSKPSCLWIITDDFLNPTWWKQSLSLGLTRTSTAQMLPGEWLWCEDNDMMSLICCGNWVTNDSYQADHRDKDAVTRVLVPLDNLENTCFFSSGMNIIKSPQSPPFAFLFHNAWWI